MNLFSCFKKLMASYLLSISAVSWAAPAVLDPGIISIMNEEEQSEILFKMILDTSLLNYSVVQVQSGSFVKCLAKKLEELSITKNDNSYELKVQIQLDAKSCDDVSMGINRLSLDVNTLVSCGNREGIKNDNPAKDIKWTVFKDLFLKSELCVLDESTSLLLSHKNNLKYEFVLDEAHPNQLAVVKNEVSISSDNSSSCEWQIKELASKKWIQSPGNICKYSQETILDASKVERISYFKKTEMNFEFENSMINFDSKKLITDKTVVIDSKISNSDGI